MNRRSFFRLLAGAAAWASTQHLAWAFPEPVHAIPQRFLYARIQISAKSLALQAQRNQLENMVLEVARHEWDALARDIQRDLERRVGIRKIL